MSLFSLVTERTYTHDLSAFYAYVQTQHPVLDFLAQFRSGLSQKDCGQLSQCLGRLLLISRDLDLECTLSDFLDYGGCEVLSWQLRICGDSIRTLQPCLFIVKELERSNKQVLIDLCTDSSMLTGIFQSLRDERDVDKVVLLLEELLSQFLPRNFSLIHVPTFFTLLTTAKGRTLAYLCRVLAYLLYDSEDKLDLFKAIDPARRPFGPSILEINHCVVASVPSLIPRLIHLLNSPHISLLRHLPSRDIEDTARQDVWAADDLELTELNAQEFASHLIEVIFVLSVLLAGPRKIQVADRLFQCGFVEVACRLLDVLDWRVAGRGGNAEPALKIQLLRLINNYCEIKSDERLSKALMTETERKAVYEGVISTLLQCHLYNFEDLMDVFAYKQGHKATSTMEFLSLHSLSDTLNKLVVEVNPQKRWNPPQFTVPLEEQGLMARLVQAFRVCGDNTNRLLLSSCIEGFLRSADVITQLFIIQTGLLPDLLKILRDDACEANFRQASFDLLGEVLKFNKGAFICLSHLLSFSEQRKWIDFCLTRIVDSNVFLRALLLSTSYFDSIDKRRTDFFLKKFAPKFSASLPIFSYFHDHRLSVLSSLLTSIQVKALSQDSIFHIDISCLNTSVMFFILSHDKAQLLALLRQESTEAVSNFSALLVFWLKFYLKRGRDAHGIEQSSRVPFSLWKDTVKELRSLLPV